MGSVNSIGKTMTQGIRSPHSEERRSPVSIAARMRERQQQKIAQLKLVLVEHGLQTVREQAEALGLSRSSAWAVLQANHKHRGLSSHVIERIKLSPKLPTKARQVIEEYVRERLSGAYGHSPRSLEKLSSLRKATEPAQQIKEIKA